MQSKLSSSVVATTESVASKRTSLLHLKKSTQPDTMIRVKLNRAAMKANRRNNDEVKTFDAQNPYQDDDQERIRMKSGLTGKRPNRNQPASNSLQDLRRAREANADLNKSAFGANSFRRRHQSKSKRDGSVQQIQSLNRQLNRSQELLKPR